MFISKIIYLFYLDVLFKKCLPGHIWPLAEIVINEYMSKNQQLPQNVIYHRIYQAILLHRAHTLPPSG